MAAAGGAPPPSKRDAIAAIVEKAVPVAGAALAALIRAPWGLQRAILWLAVVLVVYPVFAFVVALYVVQILSGSPKAWIQNKAYAAFDIDSKNRADINVSNNVIDGSSLLEFDVSRDDKGDNIYIERVAIGQPVSFLTYQVATPYPLPSTASNAATCTILGLNEAMTQNRAGQLFIKVIDYHSSVQFDLDASTSALTNAFTFDAAVWKQVKERTHLADGTTIDLRVQFSAETELHRAAADCTKYRVFVVMTYNKPPL